MNRILQPGSNCSCIEPIERAGLLIDGRDYFRAFYEAARVARRYILITGWQFDSQAKLLVGDDVPETGEAVRFLPFLNALCQKKQDLRVYILAWDFSSIFTLKREFLQSVVFNWKTEANLQFQFDDAIPLGASHHHKFVVIDGWIGFVGGLDFCEGRWDVPEHTPESRHRLNGDGHPYNPHHDLQAGIVGPAAAQLSAVFASRWERAGGKPLNLPEPVRTEANLSFSVPVAATQVAFSQTQPRLLTPPVEPVQEIRQLYLDAIASAKHLIYIENQYFSSQAIYQALLDRIRQPRRWPLQVVFVLPKNNLGWLEEVSMGVTQVKMLKSLQQATAQTRNALGVYYPYRRGQQGTEHPVYVHSKLLIVDDRFLTVGSANTNNRSMGLDTELNISWEATSRWQRRLIHSIAQARVTLLTEHTGARRLGQTRLRHTRHLASLLNRLAGRNNSFLCRHPMNSLFEQSPWLLQLCPDDLSLDPEKPIVEETLYETMSRTPDSLFVRGITELGKWLAG